MLVMNVLVLALAPYVEYRSVTNRLSPRSCVRLMSNPKMTPQMIKEATERVAQGLDVLKYRAETGGLTAEEQTELTRLLDRLSQLDDVMTEAEIELQQKKIQLDAGVVFPTKRPDALRSPPDRGATSDAGLVFPVPLVGIPMSMEAPAAATSASSTAAAKEPGPHISMPAVSAPSELPPQVTIRRPPAASVPSEMPPRITIRRPAPEAPSGVSSQHANAPATVLDTWGLRTADETPFVADSDAPTAPSLGSGMGRFASPAEKRDASTIFFEGLGNLAKEPLGWLDGAKPSPLTSSLAAAAPPVQRESDRVASRRASGSDRPMAMPTAPPKPAGATMPMAPPKPMTPPKPMPPPKPVDMPMPVAAAVPTPPPKPMTPPKPMPPPTPAAAPVPVAVATPVSVPMAGMPVAMPVAVAKPVAAPASASMPVAQPVTVAKPAASPPKPATPPPVAAPASAPAAAGNDAVAAQLEALTKMVSELAAKNKALEARLGDDQ